MSRQVFLKLDFHIDVMRKPQRCRIRLEDQYSYFMVRIAGYLPWVLAITNCFTHIRLCRRPL